MSLAFGCLALLFLFILACQLLLCLWARRKYRKCFAARTKRDRIFKLRRGNISAPVELQTVPKELQISPINEQTESQGQQTVFDNPVDEPEYEVPV